MNINTNHSVIKGILPILFFTIAFSAFSQESDFNVSMLEHQAVYRGLINQIEINTTEDTSSFIVRCPNCITFEKGSEMYTYNVHPGKGKYVEILITRKDSTMIHSHKIPVLYLPNPVLFYGAVKSGNKCTPEAAVFFAKYPPQMNLTAEFEVVKWNVSIGNESFAGEGKTLSKEAQEHLKSIEGNVTFSVLAIVKGQDGINRKIGGAFSL